MSKFRLIILGFIVMSIAAVLVVENRALVGQVGELQTGTNCMWKVLDEGGLGDYENVYAEATPVSCDGSRIKFSDTDSYPYTDHYGYFVNSCDREDAKSGSRVCSGNCQGGVTVPLSGIVTYVRYTSNIPGNIKNTDGVCVAYCWGEEEEDCIDFKEGSVCGDGLVTGTEVCDPEDTPQCNDICSGCVGDFVAYDGTCGCEVLGGQADDVVISILLDPNATMCPVCQSNEDCNTQSGYLCNPNTELCEFHCGNGVHDSGYEDCDYMADGDGYLLCDPACMCPGYTVPTNGVCMCPDGSVPDLDTYGELLGCPLCDVNFTCEEDQVCTDAGVCVECLTSNDCQYGQSCTDSQCVCESSDQCAPNSVCNTGTGECVQCIVDNDCASFSDEQSCIIGQCQDNTCSAYNYCSGNGEICQDAICTTGCDTNEDCSDLNGSCVLGVCNEGVCEEKNTCEVTCGDSVKEFPDEECDNEFGCDNSTCKCSAAKNTRYDSGLDKCVCLDGYIEGDDSCVLDEEDECTSNQEACGLGADENMVCCATGNCCEAENGAAICCPLDDRCTSDSECQGRMVQGPKICENACIAGGQQTCMCNEGFCVNVLTGTCGDGNTGGLSGGASGGTTGGTTGGSTGGTDGGTTGGTGGNGGSVGSVASQGSNSSNTSVVTGEDYCEDGQQCMDSAACAQQGGTCFDPTFSCNEGDSIIGQSCCCIPGDMHLACENDQCVVRPGAGDDQCGQDIDCEAPQHTTCFKDQCVIVSGPGKNECDLVLGCGEQEHGVCQNNQCVVVSGPGDNECSSSFGCGMHTECVNNACTLVSGPGSNDCDTNADCQQTHLECQNFSCVEVQGLGANSCTDNDDCVPAVVSSSSSFFSSTSATSKGTSTSVASFSVSPPISSATSVASVPGSTSSVVTSAGQSSAVSTIIAFSSFNPTETFDSSSSIESSESNSVSSSSSSSSDTSSSLSSDESETSSSVAVAVVLSSSSASSLTEEERRVIVTAAGTCGNSRTDFGEECDDGNRQNGDGCSETCGEEQEAPTLISSSTFVCGNSRTEPGEECDDGNRQNGDDCDSSCQLEQVVRTISTEFNCGNGRLEPSEQCDDGNRRTGDGCTRNCALELEENADATTAGTVVATDLQQFVASASVCGNGVLERSEECDDSNRRDNDGCSSQCQMEIGICGDGVVQALLGEQCEQSTHNATLPYGCQNCLFVSPLCGDGNVDDGEECDEGTQNSNSPDASCRSNCTAARCGDGILDTGEQCDDGNRLNGDGCDRYCGTESGGQVRPSDSLVAGVQFTEQGGSSSVAPTSTVNFPPVNFPQGTYPQFPTYQNLPYQLPLAQLQPLIQSSQQGVAGETGPAAVAVVGAGAAAGFSWIRRRKK